MSVLFRVHAGPEIGLGHLQRSLSLAAALKRNGIVSQFLVNHSPESLDYVTRVEFPAEKLPPVLSWGREDFAFTADAAGRFRAHVVVVDSPDVPALYLRWLRDAGFFVIVRDDSARYAFPGHIVFNGNADAPRLPYVSCDSDTLFLLGPEYAVLSADFWRVSARVVREKVEHLLVILGGADSCGLMPKLLRLLDDVPGDFSVTAVVGPFFGNKGAVKAAADQAKRFVKLVESPTSLRGLMEEADVAISGAGQTLYELACVGCPTVAIQVAADQEGQLRAMAEAGCVRFAGNAKRMDILPQVHAAVLLLLADREARSAMARAGQELVDGQGAFRVTGEILARAFRGRNADTGLVTPTKTSSS